MMSQIAKHFYLDNPLIDLPIVALFLFLAVFLAVSWRALRARKGEMDTMANMPLDEEGRHG
jgi:hypothetical protein